MQRNTPPETLPTEMATAPLYSVEPTPTEVPTVGLTPLLAVKPLVLESITKDELICRELSQEISNMMVSGLDEKEAKNLGERFKIELEDQEFSLVHRL